MVGLIGATSPSTIICDEKKSAPEPSPGESSAIRMTISVTLPEFWLLVSRPARLFSEKLLLEEPKLVLTSVAPRLMKSPIWVVPRKPRKLV